MSGELLEKEQHSGSLARTIFICGGLSVFGLLTLNLDNYFPNNAYNAMESFLETRIKIKATEERAAFIDSMIWAFFATLPLVSLIPATIITPYLSDTVGRKYCIMIFLIGAAPGRVMEAVSVYPGAWPLLFIGRFLSSFSGNAFMVLLPVLITEVCEGSVRGIVGSLQTISFVTGAFLGIVLGLESIFGRAGAWPHAYVFILCVGLIGIPIAFYMKETPEFLAAKGRKREKIVQSLNFYRGNTDDLESILNELELSKISLDHINEQAPDESMVSRLFTDPTLRVQTFVSIFVSISYYPIYQLNFFSTFLFLSAGFENTAATYSTVGLKLTALVVTVICSCTTDQAKRRRPWYLFSVWGAVIASTLLMIFQLGIESAGPKPVVEGFEGVSTHSANFTDRSKGLDPNVPAGTHDPQHTLKICFSIALFCLQIFLNLGIRPVFWIVIPELFPFKYRTTAKSVSLFIFTIVSIVFCLAMSPILTAAGGYAYLMISIPMWISAIITHKFLPETGGKEPGEIFTEMVIAATPSLSRHGSQVHSRKPSTYGSIPNIAVPIPGLKATALE